MGCQLLNPDKSLQSSVRRYPTLLNALTLFLKMHILFPSLLNKYLCKNFDYQKEQAVEQVMGAVFLVPGQAMKKVGTFDNRFHLWFEEVDFCQRCKKAGLKVIYTPRAKIIHVKAQSFSQILPYKRQKQFVDSLMLYFLKYQPKWQAFILWLFIPISLFLAWVQTKFKLKTNY